MKPVHVGLMLFDNLLVQVLVTRAYYPPLVLEEIL